MLRQLRYAPRIPAGSERRCRNNRLLLSKLTKADFGPRTGGLDGRRIAPDGTVTVWRERLGISNTLCWSPDRTRFYFGDTLKNEIRVYDFNASNGAIANERPFLQAAGAGFPDSSAMDREGWLWNCRYAGGCLLHASPDSRAVERVAMPVSNLTTAAFGGPALKTLYISSAHHPGERLSGACSRLRPTCRGCRKTVSGSKRSCSTSPSFVLADIQGSADLALRIRQGVDMGRPSTLLTRFIRPGRQHAGRQSRGPLRRRDGGGPATL